MKWWLWILLVYVVIALIATVIFKTWNNKTPMGWATETWTFCLIAGFLWPLELFVFVFLYFFPIGMH